MCPKKLKNVIKMLKVKAAMTLNMKGLKGKKIYKFIKKSLRPNLSFNEVISYKRLLEFIHILFL